MFETNFGGTGARPGPKLKALSGQGLGTGPVEGLGARRIGLSVVSIVFNYACIFGRAHVNKYGEHYIKLRRETL